MIWFKKFTLKSHSSITVLKIYFKTVVCDSGFKICLRTIFINYGFTHECQVMKKETNLKNIFNGNLFMY